VESGSNVHGVVNLVFDINILQNGIHLPTVDGLIIGLSVGTQNARGLSSLRTEVIIIQLRSKTGCAQKPWVHLSVENR
jgi:hypothetical protein